MNERQRAIIREYIELHNSKVSKYLRSLGLLNNNGTLPRSKGAQINLERWFFDCLNEANYSIEITPLDEVAVRLEIREFYSYSGNPFDFEFDAAAWPSLLEEAVLVEVDDGVAISGWAEDTEPSIFVNICGESRNESYKNLFINDDLGAVADLPGMDHGKHGSDFQKLVNERIDESKDELLRAVVQHGISLINLDENGDPTPESNAESVKWFESNELSENPQRIVAERELLAGRATT